MANEITKLLIRRGDTKSLTSITLDKGELGYTTDTKRLYVGDGTTEGGIPVDYDVMGDESTIVVATDNYQHTISIRDEAVTTAKITNNAVTTAKIANNAVTTDKIKNGAVTKSKLDTTISNQIDKNIESIAGLRTDVNTVSGKVDANAAVIEAVAADVEYVSGQVDASVESISGNIDDIYSKLNAIKSYVIESGEKDSNWYRKYSDGWVECGGIHQNADANRTVTVPIPFKNTNYFVQTTASGSKDRGYTSGFTVLTESTFSLKGGYGTNTGVSTTLDASVCWYACGYWK